MPAKKAIVREPGLSTKPVARCSFLAPDEILPSETGCSASMVNVVLTPQAL